MDKYLDQYNIDIRGISYSVKKRKFGLGFFLPVGWVISRRHNWTIAVRIFSSDQEMIVINAFNILKVGFHRIYLFKQIIFIYIHDKNYK